MAAEKLPHDFPRRRIHVPGWVRRFDVPRHIVRVDINVLGKIGTHGWQVRLKKPSKFFSDVHYGTAKRGSPKASLDAAIEYLAGIYKGPKVLIRSEPMKNKQNQALEAGIREAWKKRKGKNVKELYLEAMAPTNTISPKRFYVGTENTVNAEKYAKALENARIARADFVKEHLCAQKKRGWI